MRNGVCLVLYNVNHDMNHTMPGINHTMHDVNHAMHVIHCVLAIA